MREFRLLSGEASCTLRSDRRAHPPYGIAGGRPGGPVQGLVRDLSGKVVHDCGTGELVTVDRVDRAAFAAKVLAEFRSEIGKASK